MDERRGARLTAPDAKHMLVFDGGSLPDEYRGGVVAIGNFAGVHRGHQAVLECAREIARGRGRPVGAVTFEPHPRTFFNPRNPVFRLTPCPLKARLIQALAFDFMAVLPFDAELAGLSPQAFASKVLAERLGVSHVVTGTDFRFGKARQGDIKVLESEGAGLGFAVTPLGLAGAGTDAIPFSSSAVREALTEGRLDDAAHILGYRWMIMGEVIPGEKRGREIGFPTLNVALGEGVTPRLGIYAVRVRIDGGAGKPWRGAGYIGHRPTFGGSGIFLEVHLFDFQGDLYGQTVLVEFISFVRDDRSFDSVDALKAQMAEDCSAIRSILDEHDRSPDPVTEYPLGLAQVENRL